MKVLLIAIPHYSKPDIQGKWDVSSSTKNSIRFSGELLAFAIYKAVDSSYGSGKAMVSIATRICDPITSPPTVVFGRSALFWQEALHCAAKDLLGDA